MLEVAEDLNVLTVGQLVYKCAGAKASWYPEEDKNWQVPEKYLRSKGQDINVVKDYLEKQKKQQERIKDLQAYQERQDDEEQTLNEKRRNGQSDVDTQVRSSGDSQDTAIGTPPRVDSVGNDQKGSDFTQLQKDKSHHPSKVVASWGRIHEKKQSQGTPNIAEGDNTHPSLILAEEDDNIVTWYGPGDPANPQNWSVIKKCWTTFLLCLLTFSIYIGSAIYAPGDFSVLPLQT